MREQGRRTRKASRRQADRGEGPRGDEVPIREGEGEGWARLLARGGLRLPWPGRSEGAGGKQRRAAFRKREPPRGGGSQREGCGGAEEQRGPEEGARGTEP